MEPADGGSVIGRFQIKGKLGEGGAGAIHEAQDIVLGRRVDLKTPHRLLPDDRDRFVREARALAKLSHPCISPIYDIDINHPFIVMPLLQGETLAGRIAAAPGLAIDDVLKIAIQIASGLKEAPRS